MRPTKNLFFLLLLCVGLGLQSCDKNKMYAEKKKKKAYPGAAVVFHNVITRYSEDAHRKIRIDAAIEIVEQNGDVYYPKGLSISMYNLNGLKITEMKADTGRYFRDKSIYKGVGNVFVHNLEKQQSLKTDEINWVQTKREIHTDKPVEITTPTELLKGIGLVSNEEFSKYEIQKPEGVFDINNKKN